MKTIRDIDVAGKRVLVRVDFNVPLQAGEITDDSRIRAALPTLKYLREQQAKVIVIAHLGRPKDREPELSLAPVAQRLAELLECDVELVSDRVGSQQAKDFVDQLQPSQVLMLENIRYEPGETKNDPHLAENLAQLADIYVDDAFGAAHRAHASTEGVAQHIGTAVAGLLLEKEVSALSSVLQTAQPPLVAVIGGAKVSDKIGVISRFLQLADTLIIGGAMCFPFLKAQGHFVGNSLCSKEDVLHAQQLLQSAIASQCLLELPIDLVLGEELKPQTQRKELSGVDVPDGWMGLDIGPKTAQRYSQQILAAKTVFWNGPMGAFEIPGFDQGTKAVAQAVADTSAQTVVGGGDSVAALKEFGLADRVSHLSTGGGASLEFIEGKSLPGIEVLQ